MSFTTTLKFAITSDSSSDDEEQGGGSSGGDSGNQGDSSGNQSDNSGDSSNSNSNQDTSSGDDYYYGDEESSSVPNTSVYTTTSTTSPNTGISTASTENVKGTIFIAVFFAVVIAEVIISLIFRSKRQKALIFEKSAFHLSSRRRALATSALILAFAAVSGLVVSNLNSEWSTKAATEDELDITVTPQNLEFANAAHGKSSIKGQTITVASGAEFDLYIKLDNNLCLENSTKCLDPAAGSLAGLTNTKLQLNQLGVSLTNGTAAQSIWAGIPTTSTKIASASASTTVYYGINLGSNLPAGEYTAKVTYKAVAKTTPAPEPEPEPTIATMQDFDCSSLSASGETKTLKDSRDGQEYTVYRIPTDNAATNVAGKCIMTKDLNLGAVASVSGSASTIVANGKMTLSKTDSTFSTNSGSGTITVPTSTAEVKNGTDNWDSTDSYSNRQYTASGTDDYAGRGYYSWGAAMVVCPKGWRLPTGDELVSAGVWNASTTGIAKAAGNNITAMQGTPWSFVLGGRYGEGNSFANVGTYGYYWSSAKGTSVGAYSMTMSSANGVKRNNYDGKLGFAVRCIAGPVDETPEPTATTMQSFDASTSIISIGSSTTLTDTRDNNSYVVKRLADNKVWMVQNLKLINKTITPDDSDVSSNFTLTASAGSSGWCVTGESDCYNQTLSYYDSSRSSYGALYNWYTATAGTGASTATSSQASGSICPKGWRLPTKEDFVSLDQAWGGTGEGRESANTYNTFIGAYTTGNNGGFTLSGYIKGSLEGVGTDGSWWTSMTGNLAGKAYSLNLSPNNAVGPGSLDYEFYGYAVRCIAK